MELLFESPLEALVFRYSAAVIGYFCTCIALAAAALGLWRFRFLGSASKSPTVAAAASAAAVASTDAAVAAYSSSSANSAPLKSFANASSPAILPCEENLSLSKGRFTVYFLADDGSCGSDMGVRWSKEKQFGGIDGVCDGRELDFLGWRWRGDLGWYRYQDRTAINGSVVRLWGGR
ncbi:hypothetical protein HPP92_003724 [Vanilla planifolia]|uniref:Uncharacterized protein n=1 Tax=Vanilla planifolia TaxID=51239 RepID=A0A835SG70_VANPL|nr:hypothetical protein HPP92_003724 [Vanilla planifolia]